MQQPELKAQVEKYVAVHAPFVKAMATTKGATCSRVMATTESAPSLAKVGGWLARRCAEALWSATTPSLLQQTSATNQPTASLLQPTSATNQPMASLLSASPVLLALVNQFAN